MIRICAGDANTWIAQRRGQTPTFACIFSFTDTGLIPGISAAGTTPQARQYTALADAELLARGEGATHSTHHRLPALTAGVSPALITRAVITRQHIPMYLLSTGLPDTLSIPHHPLPQVRAKALQTGQAMTLKQGQALLESGLTWGHKLAHPSRYLVIGECVVGGTTTAQAVLTALGHKVEGQMSSSHPRGNHYQKQRLVAQGISQWRKQGDASPLSAIAAVGDPMQAVAAGMALAASRRGGVLLAGGSQMLAVYGLALALAKSNPTQWYWSPEQVTVGTTRWVIEDSSADTVAIAQDIGAPYLASEIDFSQSPYFQLRAYERGFVKEGVGAGGCAIAAHLYRKWTKSQLRHAVEAQLRQSL